MPMGARAMSDAARYADMADPDRNPQFRRRWDDGGVDQVTGPDPRTACAEPDLALDELALAVATDFRAARAGGGP